MTYSLETSAELLYRTTGITELPENCDGLAACLNAAVARMAERAQALEHVATGKIVHLYSGLCPDALNEFHSRDPDCPACRILLGADGLASKSGLASEL